MLPQVKDCKPSMDSLSGIATGIPFDTDGEILLSIQSTTVEQNDA